MDTGRKLTRVRKVLKRFLPGNSLREDDRDTGSKVPQQGQIQSNVPMECGPAAAEGEQIQPRDSDVRDTDQNPGTGTSEATVCQPRDSDVRDTEQDPGTSTSEATVCQPRDSDVRDTDQDPGTGTSEATVCQPRDTDVRDTDQDPVTSTSEATVCQPRDSDVRDTDQDPGTGTSEATACQLGSSLNTELSSPQQGAGRKLTRVRKVLKRFLPGNSLREDDRDTGSKVPQQGQIQSNVPMECGPAAAEGEQIQPRDSDVRDTEQDPGTGTSEATVCQPRDSDVRDTDQDPGTGTSEATVCQPRDSDVRDTDQDPGTGTSEATVCQPRDSDVRDTEQDPGTGTSETTVCQPRDSDVRDTEQNPGTSTSEATVCQPRDSDVRGTEQDPGTGTSEVTVCQPRDSDVRDTDQDPGTGTSEATVCQPRDSDVRDTDQDPGTGTSEATVCQPRDSDVRDTEQDPGTGTSETTVCQPRDSDVRDTEQNPGTSTSEATVCQPRDSDVRDTDQNPGTGTSEATVCQLRSSLNTELSSPQQGAEPEFTIHDLLAEAGEYRLYQLTKFYGDRLKQAIEEKVERLGWMLTKEGHFSREESDKVTELTEKGNRAESSRLFLSLVMGKGSRVRRAMWESFVTWRTELPKLDRILREIQELGPDPQEYMNIGQGLSELPTQLKDVQQKHKETLRAQTETLRVNTILMREKVKVFQLVDRYAELTVISTVRDRRLVEHELLARGRDHEEWREKHLRGQLEKIRTDQLFTRSFLQKFKRSVFGNKTGMSAAVAGVPGIGKTTMVQKIVYDWATGKIYQQFQFVFSFKFRDLNSINCRINLKELILDQYPYFGNSLREVWKNREGLLFIFDGLDEFKHNVDFADGQRDTEPKHQCPDPEWWCEVSDIVYSLIQGKLLPGCSVLVTTRPTALHLLEKADIGVRAEILGFVGEERKEYFFRHFEDQTVAEAVFKHVKENEILYTMSYNPSYCWILALALGPFFTQRVRDPQRVPKTITQLYSYYIYNILKNHGREIGNPRDVLLRVGQMAFRGVSAKKIVFTDGDLINYNLQPSQFLSGFLMELLEREDSAQSVVYTFPHLTIQEFVAAVAQFLNPHPGDILKFLTEAHNTTDGRFGVFLRFVAGLSSPITTRGLEEFLGPFPHQTTCRVIDWVKEEVKRQSGNTRSEAGKRSLLNTLHYLFESQNRGLAQAALGSVETLSFSGMTLTPIDCAVLSHAIGLCDTIKQLDLENCHIQCEGIQRLGPGLHKCQELRLGENKLGDSGVKMVSAALRNLDCKIQTLGLDKVGLTDSGAEDLACALSTNPSLTELNLGFNKLGDSGVKLVSAALRNPECKIQKLWLGGVCLKDSGAEDLVSALSTNPSLTELDLGFNKLGDSGVKLVSAALRNPECKIQKLWLDSVGLTDSGAEDLVSALSTNSSLTELELGLNSLTDRSVPALRRLILTLPSLEWIWLGNNEFSETGEKELRSLQEPRPGLTVTVGTSECVNIPARGMGSFWPIPRPPL
ncbi:NACHT, LRR and PYD domains-containing protein 3-like isoform X6 [Mobula birostris]|uniref:NACHT, LRR and PYD domains-containing protein 3-like isoform X6 n=1 Tax=Mobula birostris TaxID=1983395 RepID=UPI003B27F855